MGALSLADCLGFLEQRASDSTRRYQLLLALLGILPISSFASLAPFLQNAGVDAFVIAIVLLLSVTMGYWLLRTTTRRRQILMIMELILAGILITPRDVSAAYFAIQGAD